MRIKKVLVLVPCRGFFFFLWIRRISKNCYSNVLVPCRGFFFFYYAHILFLGGTKRWVLVPCRGFFFFYRMPKKYWQTIMWFSSPVGDFSFFMKVGRIMKIFLNLVLVPCRGFFFFYYQLQNSSTMRLINVLVPCRGFFFFYVLQWFTVK